MCTHYTGLPGDQTIWLQHTHTHIHQTRKRRSQWQKLRTGSLAHLFAHSLACLLAFSSCPALINFPMLSLSARFSSSSNSSSASGVMSAHKSCTVHRWISEREKEKKRGGLRFRQAVIRGRLRTLLLLLPSLDVEKYNNSMSHKTDITKA